MLNFLRVHVVGDIVIIRRSTVIYTKLLIMTYYVTIGHIARCGDKVNLATVKTKTANHAAVNAYDK